MGVADSHATSLAPIPSGDESRRGEKPLITTPRCTEAFHSQSPGSGSAHGLRLSLQDFPEAASQPSTPEWVYAYPVPDGEQDLAKGADVSQRIVLQNNEFGCLALLKCSPFTFLEEVRCRLFARELEYAWGGNPAVDQEFTLPSQALPRNDVRIRRVGPHSQPTVRRAPAICRNECTAVDGSCQSVKRRQSGRPSLGSSTPKCPWIAARRKT